MLKVFWRERPGPHRPTVLYNFLSKTKSIKIYWVVWNRHEPWGSRGAIAPPKILICSPIKFSLKFFSLGWKEKVLYYFWFNIQKSQKFFKMRTFFFGDYESSQKFVAYRTKDLFMFLESALTLKTLSLKFSLAPSQILFWLRAWFEMKLSQQKLTKSFAKLTEIKHNKASFRLTK